MKVLFVANDPDIFVTGSAVRERMRSYAATIGELHIISRGKGVEEIDGALHLHPFSGGRLSMLLYMPKAVRSLVAAYSIEVVSAQDPFEYGMIALKGVEGTNAALHVQVHTDFLSPWFTRAGNFRSLQVPMPVLNRIRLRLADRVLPSAKGIRVVSGRIRESLLKRYGAAIVDPGVVPVAVSLSMPEPVALPEHAFSFVFITVGRLEPEKRIEDILMALARLGPRYHSVGLVVVGEGRERKRLETLTRKLGLTSRVIYLGVRSDAWGLMRSSHAFVQASAYEGYGRTLVEAALAKLPIITTDVGIVGEVFKGYEDVLATPPADPANLAAHMTAVLGDHQLRTKLSMNAEFAARKHLETLTNQPQRIADDLARVLAPIV